MSDDKKTDEDVERLDRIVDALGEHYDTVQIFVTRHESGEKGGTVHTARGGGNYFARLGQIRNWLIYQDEETRMYTRRNNSDSES